MKEPVNPAPIPLWQRSASDIADLVNRSEVSAVDVLAHFRERIERLNPRLGAFTYLDWDGATRQAIEVDRMVAEGQTFPFAGVPMGVKELESVSGWPDTDGSHVFRDRIAEADDVMVARLRTAGAVLVGLTAAPEMGMTAYTHNVPRGVTARNPWDTETSPGGSSGGSATAVAAGLVPISTGSDGGGSIRLPASLTGLVGPKPSLGRIPRQSPRDFWPTTALGPMATNVRDAARFVDVAAGPAGCDRYELPPAGVSYEAMAQADLAAVVGSDKPLRVGWVDSFGFSKAEAELVEIVRDAAFGLIEAAGMEVVEVDVTFPDPTRAWSAIGAPGVIRDFRGIDVDPDDLSPEGRWAHTGSPLVTADHLAGALDACDATLRAVEAAFETVDVLLMPGAAVAAIPAEGPLPRIVDGEKVGASATAQFTIPFNLSGHPSISVPAGLTEAGHPVGLQIGVGRFREDLMFALAGLFERTFPWPRHAPGWD